MTTKAQDSSKTLPSTLPVMALLGLVDPKDGDWARLRGMQYSSLAQATKSRLACQVAAGIGVVALAWGGVPPLALAAWVLLLGLTLWRSHNHDMALSDADMRTLARSEIRAQRLRSLVNALVWSIPLVGFGPFLAFHVQLEIWAVLSILMTASAALAAAVPLGTLIFTAIVGGSATGLFLYSGHWGMSLITGAFILTVAIGATEGARRHMAARIAETGLVEKEEVVSLLLREYEEGDADWLWQIDTARRVRSVSPRFAFALERDAASVSGTPFIELIAGASWQSGDIAPSLRDLADRIKRKESFSNLAVQVNIAGQQRWWELSGTPKLDEDGNFEGFRGVGSDITEARENSDKIAHLARYDTLTGLPNRTQLNESLSDALAWAAQFRARCAVLMIDLDRFKAVNDTLGHQVGDQLLARVSQRLRQEMGEHDMCARLGGDEFAVVIRDASAPKHVDTTAKRIIERLAAPYLVDNHTLYVGASIGSALGPRDGETVETLMRNADLALHQAKDMGGNAHKAYEPALHALAEERRQLEVSLRAALEKKEFVLHYQPVVDAGTEGVVSFEALVRWNSKEHGFVSPAKFIPLAEDTRLIVPIGEWVLNEACREAINWPEHVRIAVNVSGEQLLGTDFSACVVAALAATGLPAHRLEIEVTESIFLRDATKAHKELEKILALGCGIALDDFGTGYSSLGYLRKVRFSTIKVDRSFVQGAAAGNPESLAIIRAVVAMADSLEMSTTAEGAETEREVEMIRELGCRKIQGYFFGRPMAAKDAKALFSSRHYLARQQVA